MIFKLPRDIVSTQDLASTIMDLQDYHSWLSQNAILNKTHLKSNTVAPTLNKSAENLINTLLEIQNLNKDNLEKIIKELLVLKESASVIHITLASPPTVELRNRLVTWCRENIKKDTLIDFSFNSTLLGGMVLRFGSHIYDWSFKKQILANRHKFSEVLANVR